MNRRRKLLLSSALLVVFLLAFFTVSNQAVANWLMQVAGGNSYLPIAYAPRSTPVPSPIPTRSTTVIVPEGVIWVDHNSVDLFDQIPAQYLTAARDLHMRFLDRSVGANISDGLDCLAASSWGSSSAACRRDFYDITGSEWLWKTYTQADLGAGTVPEGIQFNASSTLYNRSNWVYEFLDPTDWEDTVSHFLTSIAAGSNLSSNDVLTFQFNYLQVADDSNIASSTNGFFKDQPHNGYYANRERWDISDIEEFQANHPDKTFFYWTTSLSRGTGTQVSTDLNTQMRDYVRTNEKILFDVADILSHDLNGNPCYDNRDGVQYCGANGCENHANDGQNYPAICQVYTTEIDGGHLGSVSGGKIRVAKAFWVLMAQIAGWKP